MTTETATAAGVQAAYQHCETITRQQAKNFAYGIALLPADKRRALSAVYAYARRIDDIGDGDLPAAEKIEQLNQSRAALQRLCGGEDVSDDLVLVALRDSASRHAIPLAAFGELIDGCEADVRGTRYTTFAELEHYCRCVAGSIGRLSLGVFGTDDPATAEPLADALGVALQITNILRDIREDLGNGRVYLPAEDLDRFGCVLTPAEGSAGTMAGPMAELIRFEADRARTWYATGWQLMPMLDRRSAACTGAMSGIYRRLLEHISARPDEALSHRMSLPTGEKVLLAGRALAGLGLPGRGRRATAPSAAVPSTPVPSTTVPSTAVPSKAEPPAGAGQ